MQFPLYIRIPCKTLQVTLSLCFEMFWTTKSNENRSFDLNRKEHTQCMFNNNCNLITHIQYWAETGTGLCYCEIGMRTPCNEFDQYWNET